MKLYFFHFPTENKLRTVRMFIPLYSVKKNGRDLVWWVPLPSIFYLSWADWDVSKNTNRIYTFINSIRIYCRTLFFLQGEFLIIYKCLSLLLERKYFFDRLAGVESFISILHSQCNLVNVDKAYLNRHISRITSKDTDSCSLLQYFSDEKIKFVCMFRMYFFLNETKKKFTGCA